MSLLIDADISVSAGNAETAIAADGRCSFFTPACLTTLKAIIRAHCVQSMDSACKAS